MVRPNGETCYCDQGCHAGDECCDDILQIGCGKLAIIIIIHVDVLVS